MTDISRRAVLTAVTATAATAAFGNLLVFPPLAMAADEAPEKAFAELSAALTGFPTGILTPNVDPLGMNHEIFAKVNEDPKRAATLSTMLQQFNAVADDKKNDVAGAMVTNWDKSNPAQVAMCFLGRSIILAWYLGAWYDPGDLQQHSYASHDKYYSYRRYSKNVLLPHSVLSPSAYSGGLVWRAMQAHPMGYSNLQFGYWGETPPDLDLFTKPIPTKAVTK